MSVARSQKPTICVLANHPSGFFTLFVAVVVDVDCCDVATYNVS